MPKQELKITDFSGGVNCYSDARDIKDNEFSQNWNAGLDRYGIVRFTGAGEKYIINHPHTNTNFVPGGGLFSYSSDYMPNFIPVSDFENGFETGTVSHYRPDADSTEVLNNTGDFSSNWTASGDFAIDSTDATYTHSSGVGSIYQTSANFSHTPTASEMHALVLTISGTPGAQVSSIKLKGGDGYFASADISIPTSDGTHTVYFKAHTTITKFQIDVVSGGAAGFNIDNISVKQTNLAVELASSPTYSSSTNYATDDYFNNMIFSIYEGPGKGQLRKITDYNGSTKIAELETAFTRFGYTGDSGAIGSIEGDNASTRQFASLRIHNYENLVYGFESGNAKFYIHPPSGGGLSSTVEFRFTANPASAFYTVLDYEGGPFKRYSVYVGTSDAECATNLVAAINDADENDRADVTAVVQSDGSASDGSENTIVYIYPNVKGENEAFSILKGGIDSANGLEIIQPSGMGIGSASSNQLLKVAASSHTLNVGEIVTFALLDTALNTEHEVLYVETNAFFVEGTSGDPTDGAGTFTSIPTSASKYRIFNINTTDSAGSATTSWNNGISNLANISNQPIDTENTYRPYYSYKMQNSPYNSIENGGLSTFLKSQVEIGTEYQSGDLGRIEFSSLNLKPGASYALSFDIGCLAPWQFFVSDTDYMDVLPGVIVYSPTAGDGTKDAVLMSNGDWVVSDEPVSNGGLAPFTNIVDNGDFNDISDTSMNDNADAESATTSSVTLTVDTEPATTTNSLNKIFFDGLSGSGTTPIGVCTAVNSTTEIVFGGGIDNDLANDDSLYTLDGWKAVGGSLTYTRYGSLFTLSNPTVLDGGVSGSSVLKISKTTSEEWNFQSNYLYQDIVLDSNCYYDLHFKYASSDDDTVLLYDVQTASEGNSLLGGWKDSGPANVFGDNEFNHWDTAYIHSNQYHDTISDSLKFDYVKFFVPPNSTESDATTVRLKFSCNGTTPEMYLSFVSVKKSFPDLVTMAKDTTNRLPVRMKTADNRSATEKRVLNSWYTYTLNIHVPSNFQDKSDWKIQLYAGKYGNTATVSSDLAISYSPYLQTQAVCFDNIKLYGGSLSNVDVVTSETDVLLLNDNTPTSSKIYMYNEQNGTWDKNFMTWNDLNAAPVYSYMNGILQISDANFSNTGNKLMHWVYHDRLILNQYSSSGFLLKDNVLDFISSVTASQNLVSGLSIDIKGCHEALWKDYNITLIQGIHNTPFDADTDPPAPTDWHFKWFDWALCTDRIYTEGPGTPDHSSISSSMTNMPIRYLSGVVWSDMDEQVQAWHYMSFRWDSYTSFITAHDNEDISQEFGMGDWDHGGAVIFSLQSDAEAPINNAAYTINPMYLPFNGVGNYLSEDNNEYGQSYFGGSMTEALDKQMGYITSSQSDSAYGEEGGALFIKSIQFDIRLAAFGSDYAGKNDEDNKGTHIDDCFIPRIQASIHKFSETDNIGALTDTDLDTLFDSASIPVGASLVQQHLPSETDSEMTIDMLNEADNETGEIADDIWYRKGLGSGEDKYVYNFRFWKRYRFLMTIPAAQAGGGISSLTSLDNFVLRLEITDPTNDDHYFFQHIGVAGWGMESRKMLSHHMGYGIEVAKVNFHRHDLSSNVIPESGDVLINLDFGGFEGEEDEDIISTNESWTDRVFKVASSTVNIFGEESPLKISDNNVGESPRVDINEAPTITVSVSNTVALNPLVKIIKIYIKDNESDIWYMQASINTIEGRIKSSTSGDSFSNIEIGTEHVQWELPRRNMLSFNEIDSYESESLVLQEDSININRLTCSYKTSVHCNNRLYVGNIKQGGKVYGDRMIKTPIGKYNVFPASNYVDVAINDGDDITGLAYYKDKLLQFKKRKVFVLDVSGDYEYLEDTFENVGVKKQCQITTTPYGVAWVNGEGCFLYDGKKMENLIDNKIGTEEFQSQPAGTTNNYWRVLSADLEQPSIGYIRSTKKLHLARNVGYAGDKTQSSTVSGSVDGYQYDFQSKGWTFLFAKTTAPAAASFPATVGLASNFVTNKDGDLLYYIVDASGDSAGFNDILKWSEAPASTGNGFDYFILRTKDFDFGSPGVRKKIYKVYVTFKSSTTSNIAVKYAINGLDTFTEFSTNSTNYDTTNGLTSSDADNWATAILKPTSSINNVYSFALQFIQNGGVIPTGFQINDFTIVYRAKNIK